MANPRSLAWYHENKDKIDKEKRSTYLKEYHRKRKEAGNPQKRSPEQQEKVNKKRREQYKNDEEYREKQKDKALNWLYANPLKKKAQRLREFGLTIEEYKLLLEKQNYKCAICGYNKLDNPNQFPFIDHCHITDKIRGLLCQNCNFGLGHFKDNIHRLRKAIQYLQKSKESKAIQESFPLFEEEKGENKE